MAHASATGSSALELVRSFDIPSQDPAYDRLLNWSWTYDSAVAAAAFVASGDASNTTEPGTSNTTYCYPDDDEPMTPAEIDTAAKRTVARMKARRADAEAWKSDPIPGVKTTPVDHDPFAQ